VEQGVRLHPQSAHMRGLLAGILLDMGELRRAQAVLEEAERIDPGSEMVQTVRKMLESMKK
jgi:protein involved in temperature-dependent protein secretion